MTETSVDMGGEESPSDSIKKKPEIDEIYLRIWEQQQESIRHRWTVISFFLSISFAIFGLSIRDTGLPIAGTAQRFAAIGIYWFSYLMYSRYATWSKFLSEYLEYLENTYSMSVAIQSRWKDYDMKRARRWMAMKGLLLYFGFLYTISVFVLWWMGL